MKVSLCHWSMSQKKCKPRVLRSGNTINASMTFPREANSANLTSNFMPCTVRMIHPVWKSSLQIYSSFISFGLGTLFLQQIMFFWMLSTEISSLLIKESWMLKSLVSHCRVVGLFGFLMFPLDVEDNCCTVMFAVIPHLHALMSNEEHFVSEHAFARCLLFAIWHSVLLDQPLANVCSSG